MLNSSAHIYWFTAQRLYCWCWFAYTDAHRQTLNTPFNNAHEYTNTRDERYIHIETIYIAIDKVKWVKRAKKRDRDREIERERTIETFLTLPNTLFWFLRFSSYFFFENVCMSNITVTIIQWLTDDCVLVFNCAYWLNSTISQPVTFDLFHWHIQASTLNDSYVYFDFVVVTSGSECVCLCISVCVNSIVLVGSCLQLIFSCDIVCVL